MANADCCPLFPRPMTILFGFIIFVAALVFSSRRIVFQYHTCCGYSGIFLSSVDKFSNILPGRDSIEYSRILLPVPPFLNKFSIIFVESSTLEPLSSPHRFIKQMWRHDVISFTVLHEVLSISSEKTYSTGDRILKIINNPPCLP
jgi:hypothetical protein